MNEDPDKLAELIAGGIIGAGLGAVLSKDKEEGALLGALLGAIIMGTIQANREAERANLPRVAKQGNKLMFLSPNGQKRELKAFKKPATTFPERFKLTTNDR